MGKGFDISKLILRVTEVIFAIIAFSCAAWLLNNDNDGLSLSSLRFMIFTGVTGFLLALFYCVVHCAEGLKRPCQGLVETVINALWVIFWLSAAASFAAEPQCKTDQLVFAFDSCSTFFAAAAFAWMSWILWMVSTALSIIDMRSGSGMPMGGSKNYPMGNAPQV